MAVDEIIFAFKAVNGASQYPMFRIPLEGDIPQLISVEGANRVFLQKEEKHRGKPSGIILQTDKGEFIAIDNEHNLKAVKHKLSEQPRSLSSVGCGL